MILQNYRNSVAKMALSDKILTAEKEHCLNVFAQFKLLKANIKRPIKREA